MLIVPNSVVYPVTNLASGNLQTKIKIIALILLGAHGLMRIIKKETVVENFFESIAIQKELDHPHIAKIHELFEDENNYYLIYEYLMLPFITVFTLKI